MYLGSVPLVVSVGTPKPRSPTVIPRRWGFVLSGSNMQPRDPRTSRRYQKARAAWLPSQAGLRCWLCDQPVDVTLPGTHPAGPTVEHRLPVRDIQATAATWDDAVALACDVNLWAICHNKCNSRQGAVVSNKRRHGKPDNPPSRDW